MALSHHKSERSGSEKGVVQGGQEVGRHRQTLQRVALNGGGNAYEVEVSDTGTRVCHSSVTPSEDLSGGGPY